jgi:hypothetical protein
LKEGKARAILKIETHGPYLYSEDITYIYGGDLVSKIEVEDLEVMADAASTQGRLFSTS